MAIHVPIVMYCLRLFMFVLQELHCLPIVYIFVLEVAITTPSFVALYLMVSEIVKCIA